MPWSGTEEYKLNVDCPSPSGYADGDWIRLGTKELCEYTVVRTDVTPTQRWLIDVIRSSNASRESQAHPRFMVEASQAAFEFAVEGCYSFKVRIRNAETSPTETVKTNHYWRKDGLDL